MTDNLERFLLYVESKNKNKDENIDDYYNNNDIKRRYYRSESDLRSLSKDSFHDGQQLQHQRQEGCENYDDHDDDEDLLAMAKRLEEECSISSDMCYTRSDKSTRITEASSTISSLSTSPSAYTSMSTSTTNTVNKTKMNNNNNCRNDIRGTLEPVDPQGVLDSNFDTFNKSDPDGIIIDEGYYDERGENNNTLFDRRRMYTATGQYLASGRNKKIPPLPYEERKERLWKSEGGHCWGDSNKGIGEDYIVNEYWQPASTSSRGRHRTKRTSLEGDNDSSQLKDINEEDEKDYDVDHQEQHHRRSSRSRSSNRSKSRRSPTLKGTNEKRDHNDVLYQIPVRRSSDGGVLYAKQRQQLSLPRRSESDGVKSSTTLYETYQPRRKNSNTSNHSSRQCRDNSTSSSYGSRSTNRRGGRKGVSHQQTDQIFSSSSFKQEYRNVSASESYNDDSSISSCSSSHGSCSISSQLSKNERCNEYYSSEVDSDSDGSSVEVLGVAEAVQYLNENNKVEKVVTVANAIRGKIRSKFLSSQLP